jgi:hypothetical protein
MVSNKILEAADGDVEGGDIVVVAGSDTGCVVSTSWTIVILVLGSTK